MLLGTAKRIVSLLRSDFKFHQFDEALDETRSEVLEMMKCPYSADVTKEMSGSKEIKKLFGDQEIIWYLVEKSRYDLTPRSLRRIVEQQVLKKAPRSWQRYLLLIVPKSFEKQLT